MQWVEARFGANWELKSMGMGMQGKPYAGFAIKAVAFGIAVFGTIFATPDAAFASAGCTALNGSFSGGVQNGTRTAGGFSAGEIITLTMTNSAGGDTIGLAEFTPGFTARLATTTAVGTRTYTVPADTSNQFTITGSVFDSATIYSWSCTPVPVPGNANTDSQKLRSVQIVGSSLAAQASGLAISSSVTGAIGNAFAGGGSPITAGEGGATLNFAADWQPEATDRASIGGRGDEATSALAYAAGRPVTKAPPRASMIERRWFPWLDVRGTGWRQSQDNNGSQLNVTGGIGYKMAPNLLVGLLGGYEDFRYDFTALAGKLKGDGGTVGGYAAWQIVPTLRWDAMLGWSSIAYNADAGTASGSFHGSRWLFSTGLTGSYRVAAYIVEPSANVFALRERQSAYVDTLATAQAARSFSAGRVALGGRVLAPLVWAAYGVTPYAGAYADWRFASDTTLPAGVSYTGIGDGWSAHVTAGLSMSIWTKGTLALGGEFGGIGANYKTWTGNVRLSMPF